MQMSMHSEQETAGHYRQLILPLFAIHPVFVIDYANNNKVRIAETETMHFLVDFTVQFFHSPVALHFSLH